MHDGVLNIYKEAGVTSFYVVARVRKILGVRKIGHTGTLDPGVCGVLPVCLGKATKLTEFLMDKPKVYQAVMLLGRRTDTQDITGKILKEISGDQVHKILAEKPGEILDNIMAAFDVFCGEIEQIPPMYSAVKVRGVKLVNAARKGLEIKRTARRRIIYGYSRIQISDDCLRISFEVECSRGTYIRTLCEDIGSYLGIPACMESLERISASGLRSEDSITLEQLEKYTECGLAGNYIIPTDKFLMNYRALTVKDSACKVLINGNYLAESDLAGGQYYKAGEVYRIYDSFGKFYALYKYFADENVFKPEKMFV